jgi:hypothetical protein
MPDINKQPLAEPPAVDIAPAVHVLMTYMFISLMRRPTRFQTAQSTVFLQSPIIGPVSFSFLIVLEKIGVLCHNDIERSSGTKHAPVKS